MPVTPRPDTAELEATLEALVRQYTAPDADKRRLTMLKGLLADALAFGDDGVDMGDLKLVAAAFAEIRNALERFAPYTDTRKVTVFGSARTKREEPEYQLAEDFSRRVADAGYMVITGAGPGIMEAGHRGAGRERSFGVNINLPFEQSANEIIDGDAKLLEFKYFFTRKLFFLKEASAVVMLPGGFGTHDEMYECLTLIQTGKAQMMPVICLDIPRGTFWKTWDRYVREHLLRKGLISPADLDLYSVTDDIDAAVDEILSFYTVYHSARVVRDKLVMRLNVKLPKARVAELSREFSDILEGRKIIQRGPLREEADEPELADKPRLVLHFDRSNPGKSYGRLRVLINAINSGGQAL